MIRTISKITNKFLFILKDFSIVKRYTPDILNKDSWQLCQLFINFFSVFYPVGSIGYYLIAITQVHKNFSRILALVALR